MLRERTEIIWIRIEFTGLSLDDLIDVALEEMGAIADTLGL